jgi:hypothetical protein
MEFARKTRAERGLQVGVEVPIEFDRPQFRARLEQGGGQGAQAGPDLDNGVARAHAGQFEGFVNDVSINEKVLPKGALGKVAELAEQVAGG